MSKKMSLIETTTVVLNIENSIENQMMKIEEELEEVRLELQKRRRNKEKLLEECFDLKQAVDTLIFKLTGVTQYEASQNTHIIKMQNKFNVADEDIKYLCLKHGIELDGEIKYNEDELIVEAWHCFECLKEEFGGK